MSNHDVFFGKDVLNTLVILQKIIQDIQTRKGESLLSTP